ncbi:MAG: PsiF family protein [Rhodanobacter sp.]
MTTSLRLLAASALFATAATFAFAPQSSHATGATSAAAAKAAPAKTRTPQQQRMADCNHQAKAEGKKGPERKAFMSTCLKSGKTSASTKVSHKTKAKATEAASAEG